MKVKVKDVKANPYRNIDHYPLNKEKIMALTNSIEETGFWDNLVGRVVDGEIQIAYGHHRIEALRLAKGFGYDFEFELTIKDLDNATMIKIMAKENMSEWEHSITVIDETIKVTKKFLESDLTFVATKKVTTNKNSKAEKGEASGEDISNFLGWPPRRVFESLRRLKAISEKRVDKQALESLKSPSHASHFISAIEGEDLTFEEQREVANKITSSKLGKRDVKAFVEKKVIDKKYPKKDSKAKKQKERVLTFHNFYAGIKNQAIELSYEIKQLEKLAKEFKDADETNLKARIRVVEVLENLGANIDSLFKALRK